MTAAELRVMLGDGPAALVCATTPPSRQVWVGADLHTIDAADLVNPRIDLACMCTDLGMVLTRLIPGTPSASPWRPATPSGWIPIATIWVDYCASWVSPADIEEIRP